MVKLIGEIFWVGSGVFFPTLGTFVGVKLLTSILPPDQYGLLSLGMSVAMGLSYSFGGGINNTVTRFFSAAEDRRRAHLYWAVIHRIIFALIKISCVVLPMIFLGVFVWTQQLPLSFFWVGAFLFGGLQIINETGNALQNAARNRCIFCINQNLFGWGRFLIAFLFVSHFFPTAFGAMLGFVFVALMMLILQWFWIQRTFSDYWSNLKYKEKEYQKFSNNFFSYLFPMALGGGLNWLQLFVDRWALLPYGGTRDVGLYFALYQLSFAPALYFSNFLFYLMGPILYGKAGDGSNQKYLEETAVLNEHLVWGILSIFLVCCVPVFLWGEHLCKILIDPLYSEGFWALPWLFVSGGIYAVGQQLIMSVYTGIRINMVIPLRAGSVVLAFVCYFWGAYMGRFAGVIYASVIFSSFFFLMAFVAHCIVRKNCSSLSDFN